MKVKQFPLKKYFSTIFYFEKKMIPLQSSVGIFDVVA